MSLVAAGNTRATPASCGLEDARRAAAGVHGWLTDREGQFLFEQARAASGRGVVLEIGSWQGKSTIFLAKGAKAGAGGRVVAIDPHTGSPIQRVWYGEVHTLEAFRNNLRKAGVDDTVEPIVATSEAAARQWRGEPIEFLWIDGNHEYEDALLDYTLWEPFLVEGGIIAFHDTKGEGAKIVVEQHLYGGTKFRDVGFLDSITFGRKASRLGLAARLRNRWMGILRAAWLLEDRSRLQLRLPRWLNALLRGRSARS